MALESQPRSLDASAAHSEADDQPNAGHCAGGQEAAREEAATEEAARVQEYSEEVPVSAHIQPVSAHIDGDPQSGAQAAQNAGERGDIGGDSPDAQGEAGASEQGEQQQQQGQTQVCVESS